jgi:NAD(P)-dependent dehydrogenase (short-subunit alcohol dehydrogenase family)
MMDISGKTAIVTGAASGIGLGIATALAEAGANVVMADIQKAAVEQAANALSGTNKRVMPVQIDVTQEQSVVDALAEAERNFGKLHIACNNAGVPMHGTGLIDVPPGDWEFVTGVNVWGIIYGIRHFVPAILKHGEEGHIVNTASVAGFQNRRGTNQGPYSMSKYAGPFIVRGVRARTGRHQCRRFGAMPRSDRHEHRSRSPQPPRPYGRSASSV